MAEDVIDKRGPNKGRIRNRLIIRYLRASLPRNLRHSSRLHVALLYILFSTFTLPLPLTGSLKLLLYFRNIPTGLNNLLSYFSILGTCQLDAMIFGLVRKLLHELSAHMPTAHNDLCASENVKVRNSEFPE